MSSPLGSRRANLVVEVQQVGAVSPLGQDDRVLLFSFQAASLRSLSGLGGGVLWKPGQDSHQEPFTCLPVCPSPLPVRHSWTLSTTSMIKTITMVHHRPNEEEADTHTSSLNWAPGAAVSQEPPPPEPAITSERSGSNSDSPINLRCIFSDWGRNPFKNSFNLNNL